MKAFLLLISLFSFTSSFGQTDLKKIVVNKNDSSLIEYKYLRKDSCICSSIFDTIQKREIFKSVDKMPIYGERIADIVTYLRQNLIYPVILGDNINCMVYLKFIVETDGKLTTFEVLKSPEQRFSEKAIEVVKNMPLWKSGECNGKRVPVYYIVPVRFRLE